MMIVLFLYVIVMQVRMSVMTLIVDRFTKNIAVNHQGMN